MIEIITATRLSPDDFWAKAALAVSLGRIMPDAESIGRLSGVDPAVSLCAHVAFENRRGLPEIYNARILADEPDAVLVFLHDDVWLDDYFFAQRILDGTERYDVIGVAGTRRRAPRMKRWIDDGDEHTLSGRVAHGELPFGHLTYFGPAPAQCELLDGVCLAAKRSTLRNAGVLFDPQFEFHFYDLDFCRTAVSRGLRLGTWPIAITHQSTGADGYNSAAWQQKRDAYFAKWGE